MSFSIIILLLVAHWAADFVFQKEEWARNKHKSFTDLMSHTVFYAMIMWAVLLLFHIISEGTINGEMTLNCFYFWGITLVSHTLVDFVSSKINHKLIEKEKYYTTIPDLGFFSMIGLDQLIHYILLFGTYKIIFL